MARQKKSDRYRRVERIDVYLWGKFAGAVALDPTYGVYVFAYDPNFASLGIELSPLQMPVSQHSPFFFPDLPEATFKRLPAMLADALPDDFGNALIDRFMADRGIAANRISALDRLAYMGKRAMGALEFRPARGPATRQPTAIEMSKLVTAARQAVQGSFDNEGHSAAALRSIIEVGTSAGGARAKAVIAWNPQTDTMLSGQMAAPAGYEHWLLKFDGMGTDNELGASRDYGRIEYAYHLMAKKAGIHMMPCQLLHENGRSHFMTQRFDREGTDTRHHMQTLCAMAHVDYKKKGTNAYSQLFMTMRQLDLPHQAMAQAFRRMVFNVAAKNCDDHSKNFSFLLRHGTTMWTLAPAYDITFAHNPVGEWTSQHLMSVNGKYRDITINDLNAEAERFGIGEARDIISDVRAAILTWKEFADTAGVSEIDAEKIGAHHGLH
jgi:serine/threonine-protein kinase HipA